MKTLKAILLLIWLPFYALAQNDAPVVSSIAGQIVWWGRDDFSKGGHIDHTNGLVENGNDFLNNAVAVTAMTGVGLALRSDSTVFPFGISGWPGVTDVPVGLSNIVTITAQNGSLWAIKRDGTVANWGSLGSDEQNKARIITGLSNVTAIAWAGDWNYVASKNDGTLLGFRSDNNELPNGQPEVRTVRVQGQVLSNVVALASKGGTPIVLKSNGWVYRLGGEMTQLPYQYDSADPVIVSGEVLTNVVGIAGGRTHALALKKDGTVVAWGSNIQGETAVPSGLSNVTAIAAAEYESLALKHDGTVTAWGANNYARTSVPAGLSNVVAIAAGGDFSLAVITGGPPTSVFVQPHGRIEAMTASADLVFKGQALSSVVITNLAFRVRAEVEATQFRIISVLKGTVQTNLVTFQHYSSSFRGGWSGREPPAYNRFEIGKPYLIFAAKLDKPDIYYDPTLNTNFVGSNDFRQLYDGGFTRTLDVRSLNSLSVKAAHWFELNLLLNDSNPSNQLYAIDKLDSMSLAGRGDDEWSRSPDFKRKTVLTALLPVLTNSNVQVACRALNCFVTGPDSVANVEPFADALIKIANEGDSSSRRLNAIDALSGIDGSAVSNSLSRLLKDSDGNVRLGAVRMLPRFPRIFAEQSLRDAADDESANVRSVVADVIGGEKYERCLPVLVKLFHDPVGRDKLIPPTTMEYLQAGQRWSNIGDVHTAAGYALVKFAPNQVADILKTNLNDPGFHINFVAKLAQGDAEPWLLELVSILEARRAYVDDIAKTPPLDPRRFSAPGVNGMILTGTYTECWEDIRQYLLKKSPEELASGKYDRYMDLLDETVGNPQDRWLYELYRTKNLGRRAAALRRQHDKTDGWWFDDFNNRGEAAQVGAIIF